MNLDNVLTVRVPIASEIYAQVWPHTDRLAEALMAEVAKILSEGGRA